MAGLDDFEIYWEYDQLDEDAVFRLGIDTIFSPTAFDYMEMGGSRENHICSTERRTDRTLLQQHHLLRDQQNHLLYWEVVHPQQVEKLFQIMFKEICFNNYYRACVF